MHKKVYTLSIVIPAYNEEDYLGACLESIAAQTVKPKEVVVVDNNSTDRTAEVAKSFPFVTLLREEQQGQIFAQATGFDYVSGDIIGRIDADSVLPADWVGRVTNVFSDNPDAVAFTGVPKPYDVSFKRLTVALFQLYHNVFTAWQAGHQLLYGTNCAFRAELWPKAKKHLHLRLDIWEDYDLGFALAKYGKIIWKRQIVVGCSFRKLNEPFGFMMSYQWRGVRTFHLNTSWWRTWLQGLLWASIVLGWPLELIVRFAKLFSRTRR